MRYYVVYRTIEGQKYISMIEQNKEAAVAAEAAGLSYTHWDTDISGDVPRPDPVNSSAWNDARGYAEKRRCAYRMEADTLKQEADGAGDDGDTPNSALTAWRDMRAAIKQKYPKS